MLGSRVEMGQWDPSGAVPMKTPQKLASAREPSLWVGDVQLAEPFKDPLWFKFVKRTGGSFIWEGTQRVCTTFACLHVKLIRVNSLRRARFDQNNSAMFALFTVMCRCGHMVAVE